MPGHLAKLKACFEALEPCIFYPEALEDKLLLHPDWILCGKRLLLSNTVELVILQLHA